MARKSEEVKYEGVRKRENGKFDWRAGYEGLKGYGSGYERAIDAHVARQEWLDDMAKGYKHISARGITLFQLFEESINNSHYAPATIKRKLSLIENHVKGYFNKDKLAVTITAADIENFLLKLGNPTKDKNYGRDIRYSQEYINGFYKLFSAAFKYGVKAGYLKRNVVQAVDLKGAWTKCGIPKEEGKFLYPEQLRVISDTLKTSNCYTAFMIGLHSGCRVSEVFALRWPDVDWDRNEIHVSKQLLYDNKKKMWYIAPLKSRNSDRYIPLSPVLKEYLLDLKSRQEENKKAMGDNYRDRYRPAYFEDSLGKRRKVYITDFINVKANGEWLTTSSISYATRRREETTGKYRYVLNGEQIEWSFHDLRHTFATKAALSGVAISDLQRILGHSKQSTTERFYLHDEEGRLRINPERDRILFAGLSDMTEAIDSCPETDLYAEHKAFAEKIETIKAYEQKDEEIPDLNELDMSFENGIGYSKR